MSEASYGPDPSRLFGFLCSNLTMSPLASAETKLGILRGPPMILSMCSSEVA